MSDLAERALDTAAQNGATYADVRLVRRRAQHVDVKMGHVQAVALERDRGAGRPGPRRRRLGLREHQRPARPRGRPRRRPRDTHRPRVGARARGARSSSTTSRRVQGSTRRPIVEDPFEVPIDATVELLLEADAAMGARRRAWPRPQADYHAFREWKTFASSDGSRTEQVITHVGASLEVNAAERRRAPAAHVPRVGRRLPRRRLRARPRARPASRARPARRGGRRAAERARAAAGPADDRAPSLRSSTSRSTRAAATRPSSTASSAPRRPTRARAS